MGVCRELGKTLAEGFEMSILEIKLWAAFFKIDAERTKERLNRDRRSIKGRG
jgi:hypothetical protein